jgi:aryl-alcohol dehydrogenase-like predicted oxidoreductase
MGKVGFGGYRVSIKSKEHYDALVLGLKNGLSLIDTSSNYTNGESEELIGKVLEDHPEFNPIIVTKAGYIQGQNLEIIDKLNENKLAIDDLVIISEDLKHSIHPEFLKDQLDRSLNRLKRKKIDVFLLHNPEYYFKSENSSQDEFYNRIQKAFAYLETEVESGRISSYGISSNNFILPHHSSDWVSLEKIIEIAKSLKIKNHFTHIQFPMNLIEIGALEKYGEYGEISLLELAKFNNLITMTNRPLNAFTQNKLIRLATYQNVIDEINDNDALIQFEKCMNILEEKWNEERNLEGDEEIDNLKELTLIKQFSEMWDKITTPDAVDQVYYAHLFPFIAQVYGRNLSKEESGPFYDLYEFSQKYSRKVMTETALSFRNQALNVGLIQEVDKNNFAFEVIETYLNYGIDYVLVGMRKPEYINQLTKVF